VTKYQAVAPILDKYLDEKEIDAAAVEQAKPAAKAGGELSKPIIAAALPLIRCLGERYVAAGEKANACSGPGEIVARLAEQGMVISEAQVKQLRKEIVAARSIARTVVAKDPIKEVKDTEPAPPLEPPK